MRSRLPNSHSLPGVLAVEVSGNKKLGLASATYSAQTPGCPDHCVFLGNGCYYEYGPAGLIARRLEAQAKVERLTPVALALNEAAVIGKLTGRLPLRLHAGGDCKTPEAAYLVGQACEKYARRKRRLGAPAWGYTHAWREIERPTWGKTLSVLASCESVPDALEATSAGYAAALVVPSFLSPRPYALGGGLKLVPCPEQAGKRGADCSTCGLCFKDAKLRERGRVIGFTPHGSGAKKVALSLPVLEGCV